MVEEEKDTRVVGDTPSEKIEKAIRLVELERDLENLQRQAAAIVGALQYVQQKIAQLRGEGLKPVDKF